MICSSFWSCAIIMLLPLLPSTASKRCTSIIAWRHYHSPIRNFPSAFTNRCRSSPLRAPNDRREFRGARPLYLNRILFDASEIDEGTGAEDEAPLATVTFPKDDYRTVHVAKVLGLRNGDSLRAGSVRNSRDGGERLAGLLTDDALVSWLPEGKMKKAQPTKNGDPPGSLRLSIPRPPRTSLWDGRDAARTAAAPPVSLLLALPRPLQLGRILPMASQMGIDRLVLANAKKVPKDYFGSHIFREPEVLRGLLIEGLAQSGDVGLPSVTVTRRLKVFMEDDFDELFPPGEVARVIAHPQRKSVDAADDGGSEEGAGVNDRVKRMSDVEFPGDGPRRMVVAVGPEGGWEEPYELDMFTSRGFQQVTLGTRVLRSDVAVVSLLALAHEVCAAGDPRP